MKTSIFDMTFTLTPMLEMTEVVKDVSMGSISDGFLSGNFMCNCLGRFEENT